MLGGGGSRKKYAGGVAEKNMQGGKKKYESGISNEIANSYYVFLGYSI